MRCPTCKYDLSNLTEHRCPECGRAFDPNDASTFEAIETRTSEPITVRQIFIAAPVCYLLNLAFVAYAVVKHVEADLGDVFVDPFAALFMLIVPLFLLPFTLGLCIIVYLVYWIVKRSWS